MIGKKKSKVLIKVSTIYQTMLSMLPYCLKKKNPKAVRTKKERIMILSKFAVCDSKNSLKSQKLVDY